MKNILQLSIAGILLIAACSPSREKTFGNDFSSREKKLLKISREIINHAYFATLITHGQEEELHARIMEPFPPDSNFVIWLGTNRLSRKVKEIHNNPHATLFYFDASAPGYVSLYGKAELVDDEKSKQKYWRKAWKQFYPEKKNYLLIRFIPYRLEMIHPGKNLPGDSITWKPYEVILRK